MSAVTLLYLLLSFIIVSVAARISWTLALKVAHSRFDSEHRDGQKQRFQELVELRQYASHLDQQVSDLRQRLKSKDQKLEQAQQDQRRYQLAAVSARKELEAAQNKMVMLEKSEHRLGQQFENLANKIFESKVSRFSAQNKVELESLLGPFRQQIADFRQQVAQAYDNEAQQRRSLRDEISGLKQMNQQMSEDAINLTRALKGDKKLQGNWGELVLDRVLEDSGLREGHEYVRQVSLKSNEGERQQPDVVVRLPDGKYVIIDSKVSLVDFSRSIEAETDVDRNYALGAHVKCLRNHIRSLAARGYHDLNTIHTLDYVLMFIPVEAAFYSAIEHHPELFQEALDNNIMLVSPTNLLVTLRTIENIWRYEDQNRNALQIAEKAAALYDKLRGFTEDMQKLGVQLNTVLKTYDGAMTKFSTGRGNAIRQAQQFVELGVKVKKPIDSELVERANTETDEKELPVSKFGF